MNSWFILTNLLFTGKKKYHLLCQECAGRKHPHYLQDNQEEPRSTFQKLQRKTVMKKGKKIKVLQNKLYILASPTLPCRTVKVTWMSSLHKIHLIHSLSDLGKLYLTGTNSDILQYLEQYEQSRPATFNIWLQSPCWSHNCPLPARWKC